MKKNRYIPYGYTIQNGRTVVDRKEADIIREIFDQYVSGASLREIADMLTQRKIPYTEKSDVWGKARIARIIDNARYTGDAEYEPIIEDDVYENAVNMKTARQSFQTTAENEGLSTIRNRVKCAECGYPMVRKVCSKYKVKESWTCTNPDCGVRVRISDTHLLDRINILLNRIILNSELMVQNSRTKYTESPTVQAIQQDIDRELMNPNPSEEYIIDKVTQMASTMYDESDAKASITLTIAKRRVDMMHTDDCFNPIHFTDIVSYITISKDYKIALHTKTNTDVKEGE